MENNESTAGNIQSGASEPSAIESAESPEGEDKKAGTGRNEQGQWIKGVSGNPEGMTPMTEAEKLAKKATKELIEDYKNKLAESLPKIEPVLVAKALKGDISAIKEINDRVIGKPKQPLVGDPDGENPLIVNIIRNDRNNNPI